MARNHASLRHRRRRFRRVKAVLTLRCHGCRRRLDPAFTWRAGEPWCSSCNA